MPDPTLEPDVQFFDDFTQNDLGVGVPIDWELLVGQTPEIVADPKARGGKALALDRTGVHTVLGYTPAGDTHDSVEVLVAIRTTAEGSGVSPYPYMSGPGGRLQAPGGLAAGLGLQGGTRTAYCVCGFLCQRGIPFPRGTPREGQYPQAEAYPVAQKFHGIGGDNGGFTNLGIVENPGIYSGVPVVGYVRSGGPTVVGPLNTYMLEGTRLAEAKAKYPGYFDCKAKASCSESLGPARTVCSTQDLYGDVVHEYTFMRLRTGPNVNRIRGKWWKGSVEPENWMIDDEIINAFTPNTPGGMAGILMRHQGNDSGLVLFDWVGISIDPDNFPAPKTEETVSSNCPLPDGFVGEAYEDTLDADGLAE